MEEDVRHLLAGFPPATCPTSGCAVSISLTASVSLCSYNGSVSYDIATDNIMSDRYVHCLHLSCLFLYKTGEAIPVSYTHLDVYKRQTL